MRSYRSLHLCSQSLGHPELAGVAMGKVGAGAPRDLVFCNILDTGQGHMYNKFIIYKVK